MLSTGKNLAENLSPEKISSSGAQRPEGQAVKGGPARRSGSKQLAGISMLALAGLLLSACFGGGDSSKQSASPSASGTAGSDKPIVYASIGVLASLAKEIAGDKLQVRSVVQPGGEVHDYDPTPQDVRDLSSAKLLMLNGLGLEKSWLEKLVTGYKGKQVTLSAGIAPIEIGEDSHKGDPNPHAWVSPKAGITYAKNISSALSEVDPQNKSFYEQQAAAAEKKLSDLESGLKSAVEKIPQSQRALVTCEGAFSYLTKDTGMKEEYLWAVNGENAGTAKQLSRVVDFVKKNGVKTVFCEQGVKPGPMEQVVSATGAKLGETLYVESLVGKTPGSTITYLEMLGINNQAILKGLG